MPRKENNISCSLSISHFPLTPNKHDKSVWLHANRRVRLTRTVEHTSVLSVAGVSSVPPLTGSSSLRSAGQTGGGGVGRLVRRRAYVRLLGEPMQAVTAGQSAQTPTCRWDDLGERLTEQQQQPHDSRFFLLSRLMLTRWSLLVFCFVFVLYSTKKQQEYLKIFFNCT